MPERQEISPQQVGTLLLGFLIGTSIVLPMGVQVKQDAWLAILAGGGAGLGMLLVYAGLARYFPGQSLIGYSKCLLGPWLGGLVGLLYLWYGLHLGALVLRNFGEFLITTILVGTPISVPLLILMLLTAYGVRHGLEPMARSSQVLTPVVLLQLSLATIMLVKEMRPERLLPIMENGLEPILVTAFSVFSFPFGEAVLFAMILPHVRPVPGQRRSLLMAMTVGTLLLAMLAARNVAVLGAPVVGAERFPSFGVVQEIDVADFLTRLDALIIANWIATGFIKLAVCLFVVSRGLAEWVHVADYRPLVLPLGALMVALAILVFENVSEQAVFATVTWPVYSVPFQLLLPLLLLGIAWLRSQASE